MGTSKLTPAQRRFVGKLRKQPIALGLLPPSTPRRAAAWHSAAEALRRKGYLHIDRLTDRATFTAHGIAHLLQRN